MTLVLRQGIKLAALGVVLGLVGAWILTRWLTSLLYGVTTNDPLTLVVITLLPMMIATLASWLPARRATKVDPVVALRSE
jgi:ABC-type lipoprotein release transport system permease subunit